MRTVGPSRARAGILRCALRLAMIGIVGLWPVAALAAQSVASERVQGRVLLADGAPAGGVHVIATRADGAPLDLTAITSADGRFVLTLPATRVTLTARRIGHRPVPLAELDLSAPPAGTLEFTLQDAPVTVDAVRTTATSRCASMRGAVPELVALVEDVRLALRSVRLVSADGPATSRIMLTEALTSVRGSPLAPPAREIRTGSTARPFQAISARTLRTTGYVVEETDGTVYRAPDSEVLTSDLFLADHCFRLAEERSDAPERLGVEFEPLDRPAGLVDIRGTFWLDRATRELETVEFTYVGLPRELQRAPIGGRVDFLRLPDGSWFERRWEIRMPRTSRSRGVDPSRPYAPRNELTVDALQVASGEVLELRRGERVLYTADVQTLAEATESERAADDDAASGTSANVTAAGSVTGSATGSGTGSAAGSATAGDEASRSALRLTSDSLAMVSVCDGGAVAATSTQGPAADGVLLGTVYRRKPERWAGATITAAWKDDFRSAGQAEWRWTLRTLSVQSDANGAFRLCGVPRNRPVEIVAAQGEERTSAVVARVSDRAGSSPVVRLELALEADMRAARPSRGSVLRIVDKDGAPVSYAVVNVAGGNPLVADDQGRVLLNNVSALSMKLRVRRLGLQPFDGEVSRPDAGTAFEVRLRPLASTLAAVEVRERVSRPLETSGFYDRIARVRAGAYTAEFITPEEIATRNVANLSQLLQARRGVFVQRSKDPGQPMILMGRGRCPMIVLLDGVRINMDTTSEGAVRIDALAGGRQVAGIEVYGSTANAPSELIPLTGNGSCGLVAIWTGAP